MNFRLSRDGHFVKADGCTLQADDGIGLAYLMELMTGDYTTPNLEFLFTVQEEVGLGGIKGLGHKLESVKFINLDSEEDDKITIGCAGGARLESSYTPGLQLIKGQKKYKLTVKRLPGGHSGIDIDKDKGNAIKIGGEVLDKIRGTNKELSDLLILDINGGEADNAIPKRFTTTLSTNKDLAELEDIVSSVKLDLQHKYKKLKITIEESGNKKDYSFDREGSNNIINALLGVRSGVYYFDELNQSLVETSNNLGVIQTKDGQVTILNMTRSSNDQRNSEVNLTITRELEAHKFSVKPPEKYEAWEPNPNSELLRMVRSIYQSLFGEEFKIEVIHAGLECGTARIKNPILDPVSIGPNIIGAHTTHEKVGIKSVEKIWELLKYVLNDLC
jgi:dipeptidase D